MNIKILFVVISCLVFGKGPENKKIVIKSIAVGQWHVAEITLTSHKIYTNAFNDVDITATFTGPHGEIITRPAFWDGGSTWRVRFAPTSIGRWEMLTSCTDQSNADLNNVAVEISSTRNKAKQLIYEHGFLKISPDKRYFTYNDGTPFFYLGDTHWLLAHERFSSSNVNGVKSQFFYTLNKRVKQGFTVYQSEPIQLSAADGHGGTDEEDFYNLDNGFTADDLPGFANLDRKFKAIADAGLVHANAALTFVVYPARLPLVYTDIYLQKLARYWVARYGAYPVLWTVAQESDTRKAADNHVWETVAETIAATDGYHQPLTLHMQDISITNASNSYFQGKSYHNWRAVQLQYNISSTANVMNYTKAFWNSPYRQPTIDYESGYEGFQGNTTKDARAAGYRAFQTGMFGIGYGVNGVWNDLYTPKDLGTAYLIGNQATYLNWYDGANQPGANQLTYLKTFYSHFKWWKLVPKFDDTTCASFSDVNTSLLATIDKDVYIVYFFNKNTSTGTVKNLEPYYKYIARWFNPSTGRYFTIGKFTPALGAWPIPPKPDAEDWILVVERT